MSKYELDDDYSLAISYIEGIVTGNDDLATSVERTVSAEDLTRGLILASTLLLLELKTHYPEKSLDDFIAMVRSRNFPRDTL